MKQQLGDWRNIRNGFEIPTEHYSDQPYIVRTDDGAWLCTVTTGAGAEGQRGQHVISMRSMDRGQTWEAPVDVEPADGPEASYAALLKVPSGRIYCFYNHNSDNMREVIANAPPFNGGKCTRVDSLGYHVFKYSDDHGRTWSPRRYAIPIREMDADRQNPYGGKVQFFWNVGKPFIHEGAAYVSVHKVGGFGEGFFTRSEGVLLKSRELVGGDDPATFEWETLPDGEFGLRTPPGGGPIAEEQSYCVLSDGSFYCVYRTVDGHPVEAYSRDGGHTWSVPQYKAYAAGHRMKHPRAANFAWKCENGNYLYWFHNHGGQDYEDRNPVWLCGGVEAEGPEGRIIKWSQPEIILYDDDPYVRMSYPDLVEEDGSYFITETQKDVARVHRLDSSLLEGLWAQFDGSSVTREGLLLELQGAGAAEAEMPPLPALLARDCSRADYGTRDLRQGFALELWLQPEILEAGQVLLDTRTSTGEGVALQTTAQGAVEVVLNDGRSEQRWRSDQDVLKTGSLQHVVLNVDGGPKVISFVANGILNDGGLERQFGWGRFSPQLRTPQGSTTVRLGVMVRRARVYGRFLRTSEAISNFRAGEQG